MLNKRGIGQEIDWILGVGLFLMSVVFIFVLFRPGINPVYDSQTLLDIAQEGFNNDTMWEITTVPVFVYPTNSTYASGGTIINLSDTKINVDTAATSGYNGLIDIITDRNELNIEVYYVSRSDSDDPPSGFDVVENDAGLLAVCGVPGGADEGGGCGDLPGADGEVIVPPAQRIIEARGYYGEEFDRANQMKYNLTMDEMLTIPAILETDAAGIPIKTKYLVTVSNKPINFFSEGLDSDATLNACAKEGTDEPPHENNDVALACPVIYELGLKEKASGIDLASFLYLNETDVPGCGIGYECIKEKWKFPPSKEFNIKIESLPITIGAPGGAPLLPFNSTFPSQTITPPENINIFVRQFNSFILTDDGTRIPVTVRITIW